MSGAPAGRSSRRLPEGRRGLLPSREADNALCTSGEGDNRGLRGESGEIGAIDYLWGGIRPGAPAEGRGSSVAGSSRHGALLRGYRGMGALPIPLSWVMAGVDGPDR